MSLDTDSRRLVQTTEGEVCCSETWEEAYQRFETPEEECRKFLRRLKRLGAASWPRDAEVVELFCGRGNGLAALSRLGFTRLEGVDLSSSLLANYQGTARCYVADCRRLPFNSGSKDILIVQGGLHHLTKLPEDLEQTLQEAQRILRRGGRFVAVEPWLTPFLRFVHAVCDIRLARNAWPKLDALATMNECERPTYEQWLSRPKEVSQLLGRFFEHTVLWTEWGKLFFVGTV
jgi:ubiquinone/menaquinone biosynthesis C-methylase UbiE